MATFIPVQFGNTPGCYINLDLVKMVTPTNAGCIVHFDKGHTIGITTSAREVLLLQIPSGAKRER